MNKRKIVALAAAALAVTGMVSAVSTPASASASTGVTLGTSSIVWGPCTGDAARIPKIQCAMLSVPLDYSKPNGAKIQLAISRIKHTVPDSQFQGVMLTNPGGPGGSGLTLSVLKYYVPNGAGNAYDWIGFDPRGVGSSVPSISCDLNYNYAAYDRPNYIPVRQEDLTAWNTRSKNYAQSCGKYGDLLNHMTTVDSVNDMDSIRKALGADQINYYGFSYGTYLGQVYSTMYPSKVRRMVLDSNVDPRQIWYAANLNQDIAFNTNIKIWFGWLAQYDSVYHLGATENAVETLFYKTQSKLMYKPAKGKIGGDEWIDTFLNAGYYQQTWLELAQVFSDYVNNNDVKDLIAEFDANSGIGDDNGFAVYNAVQCTDIQYPTDPQQVLNDNWAVYRKAPFETWANNWFNAPCQYWPAAAHSTTPFKVDGSKVKSALLIDETLDAATPYEGSLYVRKIYPNSRLIALPGGTSHANSLNGDACLDDQIAAYLQDGTLPANAGGNGPDATCAPLPVPAPTASAATATPAVSPATPGVDAYSRAGVQKVILANNR